MAIYSSSINSVSAAFVVHGKWTCTQMYSSPNYASCNLTISGTSTDYNCNYDTKTKKWTCVKAKSGSGTPNQMPGNENLNKMTDSQIPLGLKTALDSAIKTENGGLVMGQSNATETEGEHSNTSAAKKHKLLQGGAPGNNGLVDPTGGPQVIDIKKDIIGF